MEEGILMRDWPRFSTFVFLVMVLSGCSGGGSSGGTDTHTEPPPSTDEVPVQLNTLGQRASLHLLAVNRVGDLAAVWQVNRPSSDQLWVTPRSLGASWAPPQIWADVEFVFPGDVTEVLRDSRQMILVWEEQTRILVQTRSRADGGTPELLAERGEIPRLTLVPTALAPAMALWRENRPLQISTHLPGTGWSPPEPVPLLGALESQDDPAVPLQAELGAAADGVRMVMWRDFAEMRAVRWAPAMGWEEPAILRDTDTLIGDFALAVSANGTAIAVWCERSSLGSRDLVAIHFNGNIWTSVVWVAVAQCPARAPELKIEMDDEGNGVVLWESGSINAARYRAGQWEAPHVFSETGRNAVLSVHPSGVATAVWLEGSALVSPQSRLVMRGFFGPTSDWTPPKVLAERFDLIGNVVLRVAAGPDGRVVVVWDTELGELWSVSSALEP